MNIKEIEKKANKGMVLSEEEESYVLNVIAKYGKRLKTLIDLLVKNDRLK